MASGNGETTKPIHLVAMPYPGRGHINPMMNFCELLASKNPDILITIVVTEEWFGFIGSHPKPGSIRFATIPNCVPSELDRGRDLARFVEAVSTNMEAPFQSLIDALHPPPTLIMHDTYLLWVTRVGKKRNIPVASFYTMSASNFCVVLLSHLFGPQGRPLHPSGETADEDQVVDCIPGMPPTRRLADVAPLVQGLKWFEGSSKSMVWTQEADCVLLPTVYELESGTVDALREKLHCPIYTIGPPAPFFKLGNETVTEDHNLQWLHTQPQASVLYVSLGSFMPLSSEQIEEIAAGLRESGVPYLWVARGEAERLKQMPGERGRVVPWCDQLKVLSHPSVGGFWSHCGWNSTLEGLLSGLPFLTFPLIVDQFSNSKMIVEDWKIGWRINKHAGDDGLITRAQIADLVKRFMDLSFKEGREMRKTAKQLGQVCQQAVRKGGSTDMNVDAFFASLKHIHGRQHP